jgi:hypothetical protein
MTLQVKDRDEVLEPYSRCGAPEARYQQVSGCVTASAGRRPGSGTRKTEGLDHWSKKLSSQLGLRSPAAGPDSASLAKPATTQS